MTETAQAINNRVSTFLAERSGLEDVLIPLSPSEFAHTK